MKKPLLMRDSASTNNLEILVKVLRLSVTAAEPKYEDGEQLCINLIQLIIINWVNIFFTSIFLNY